MKTHQQTNQAAAPNAALALPLPIEQPWRGVVEPQCRAVARGRCGGAFGSWLRVHFCL